MDSEALATLVLNKLRGSFKICAVKAPGFGDNRKNNLNDLAILTGGQVITEDVGIRLDQVEMSSLGSCRRLTVTKEDTVIMDG